MIYLRLFYEFFKTGLFSIGGGLATLPFIYELMDETHWFDMGDISNMIALSECTPGPMGVNMATYVGNVSAGIAGGVCATFGLVAPSVIIIDIVAHFLKKFKESKLIKQIMSGLRPASTGLILVASVSVALVAIFNQELFEETGNLADFFNIKALILAAILLFIVKKFKNLHPIAVIVIAAAVGIVFSF